MSKEKELAGFSRWKFYSSYGFEASKLKLALYGLSLDTVRAVYQVDVLVELMNRKILAQWLIYSASFLGLKKNSSVSWVGGIHVLLFALSSFVTVSIAFAILVTLFVESMQFFSIVPFWEFFFSSDWNPQSNHLYGQDSGYAGSFGAIGVFWGSFFISSIALAFAALLGIPSAIYLAEYTGNRTRNFVKSMLEMLAGVPTVVYGLLGLIFIGPGMQYIFGGFMSGESAILAGVVVGIMILPLVLSFSDDAIANVSNSYRDGSYAMGANKAETILKVVLPAAAPGISSALLISASRAIGETMIVTMLAGLIPKLTLNPFEESTTGTAQIVNLLSGDQEFDSAKTLSAFAIGITLFFITLLLNFLSYRAMKSGEIS